jgi:hypothetical protein
MAINPLSVPNFGGPYSSYDFAPLTNLVNLVNQRRQEAAAADLLGSLYQNQQQQTPYVPSLGGGGDGGGGLGGGGGASTPLNPQISVQPGSGPSYPPLGNISGYPTALGTAANYMGWGQPNALGNATTGVPAPAPPARPTSSTGMAAIGIPALLNALTRTQPTAPPPTMAAPGIPDMTAAYPSAAAAYPPTVSETAKPAAFSGADQPTEVTPEDQRRATQPPASDKYTASGLDRLAASIRKNESSGNYANVTTTTNPRTGQRQSAIGAYGIMDFNVGPWTREVLGQAMTPQQFLSSPEAQDAVAKAKLGQYASKYGLSGAARAWIGGEGNMYGSAADAFGTTPSAYAARVTRDMGLPPEITQGRSAGAAPGTEGQALGLSGPPSVAGGPGIQVAQNAGLSSTPLGGITREQLVALARNPITAPLAQQLVMQQLSPKLIETGTDPLTGQKSFAQQIGNRLVPVGGGEGGAGAAGGSGGLFDRLTQMQQQGASKEQMLAAIPAGYRSGVQALIEGRDLPANYGRANVKASMDMLAQIVDPNFNPSRIPIRQGMQREFSPQGKTGQSLIAFGTAQHHIDEASDAVEELAKYQGRYPTINAMRAAVAAHGGDQQLADATQRFNDAMQAVGKEVAHAYNNGHLGEHEMAQWNALISSNLPPDRLRRGLFDFTRLLNGKRDTLNDTYRQEFGKDVPSINKEENEAVSRKVFSRLPDYAPEKQAAQAGGGGNTGGKSLIVIQNGHTYTLQPDGSYK